MKLLKLLAAKMDKEEQKCLPSLLNCFYYRETLFIVYELLRDNLYHMYARADRTRSHTRTLHRAPALAESMPTCLNSWPTPLPCQLQVHRRVPAAQVLHGAHHHATVHAHLLRPTYFRAVPPCLPAPPLPPLPPLPPSPHTARGRSFEQVERVQEVARQCLSTLVCLHKHGVIHCDLVRHTHRALRPKPSPESGLFTRLADRRLTIACSLVLRNRRTSSWSRSRPARSR